MKFYKYSAGDFVMRHKTIDKSLTQLIRSLFSHVKTFCCSCTLYPTRFRWNQKSLLL